MNERLMNHGRKLANWARYRRHHAHVACIAGAGARSIRTHTVPAELATLHRLALAAPDGTDALEIGSYLGASACYIGAAVASRKRTLYCVDTWANETMPEGGLDTMRSFKANTRKIERTIRLIRKRSEAIAPDDVPAKLGFVFIDGDHSYESTLRAFDKIRGLVPELGIVAFHDAIGHGYPGVARVIGAALASGNWAIGGQICSLFWITRMAERVEHSTREPHH